MSGDLGRLTAAELDAECGLALPTKEVLSLLDLDANIDLVLDLAAPIDLAVAANLNVAAPIDAAVSANVLSIGSEATAAAPQQVLIDQLQSGSAIATAPQDATLEQGEAAGSTTDGTTTDGTTTDGTTTEGTTTDGTTSDGTTADGTTTDGTTTDGSTTDGSLTDTLSGTTGSVDGLTGATTDAVGNLLDGPLLDVDVNVDADLDVAAPIAGAIAANGNIAAPIDAAVAANVLSVDSTATALASQTAVITQNLDGVVAEATADQDATVTQ